MLKIRQLFCRHDWQECSRKHYSTASAILVWKECKKCGKVEDFDVKDYAIRKRTKDN